MNELKPQTQLDRDKVALTDPKSSDQVMEIAKRSSALHKALKGMKGYEEEYYKAFEVMIEAYRIVGHELSMMEKAGGTANLKIGPEYPKGTPGIELADLGITKKQSSEWQSLALLKSTDVEEYVNAQKAESAPVTKADLLRIAQNYKTARVVCQEEAVKVETYINAFLIQAKKLVMHLRQYPETRTEATHLLSQLDLLKEIATELERGII